MNTTSKRHPDLDGKGRQRCMHDNCNHWSLRGHYRGKGLCPFHWAALNWGHAWASKCHPEHHQASAPEE